MYATEAGGPLVMNEGVRLLQAVAVAMLAGWLAERAVDTGLRIRGIGLLAGLLGLYAGRWIWAATGWHDGPVVAGLALLPLVAGAFAVCGVLKLVSLGFPGARW